MTESSPEREHQPGEEHREIAPEGAGSSRERGLCAPSSAGEHSGKRLPQLNLRISRRDALREFLKIMAGGVIGFFANESLRGKNPDAREQDLEINLETAQKTIEGLTTALQKTEGERDAGRGEIEGLKATNRQLGQQLKEAEDQTSQATSETARTKAQWKEANAELVTEKGIRKQAEEENTELKAQNSALETALKLATINFQGILRKIFEKTPIDEILLPVLGILQFNFAFAEEIDLGLGNLIKEKRSEIDRWIIFARLLKEEEGISDEIFSTYGKMYDSVLYPVFTALGNIAKQLDEKNPLAQKVLEFIEKSSWEPMKALLGIRNRFLDLKKWALETEPNRIEERRQLRQEKINKIEQSLQKDPTFILGTLDRVIDYIDKLSQTSVNRKETVKLFKDFIEKLRRGEKESGALTVELFKTVADQLRQLSEDGLPPEELVQKGQELIAEAVKKL